LSVLSVQAGSPSCLRGDAGGSSQAGLGRFGAAQASETCRCGVFVWEGGNSVLIGRSLSQNGRLASPAVALAMICEMCKMCGDARRFHGCAAGATAAPPSPSSLQRWHNPHKQGTRRRGFPTRRPLSPSKAFLVVLCAVPAHYWVARLPLSHPPPHPCLVPCYALGCAGPDPVSTQEVALIVGVLALKFK
jgi:hypothetical protein